MNKRIVKLCDSCGKPLESWQPDCSVKEEKEGGLDEWLAEEYV